MKIKIDEKHRDKINEAIKEAEGRATGRTVDYDKICGIITRAEREMFIAKKDMDGTEIIYTGAEKFPSSYKYIAKSTHFTAKRIGAAWYLTSVCRYNCPNRLANAEIRLSEKAKAAIIKRYSDVEI